jgi:hypothetical protein
MKRLSAFGCAVVLVATALHASQVPDFWYVVPDAALDATANRLVRGIVIPSDVHPTFETTPEGSVVSWRKSDGTRQSFVVKSAYSLTSEPGPLAGTTFVPFRASKRLAYDPRGCCSCASWLNSVESVEALSCVAGCSGCGCEGCICSPTFPCPIGPEQSLTLLARDSATPTMTFDKSGAKQGITVARHGKPAARFAGKRLVAQVTSKGETVMTNPDSISLSGRVDFRAAVRGDNALFAWRSADASVILDQRVSMPAPSFHEGVIDFEFSSDDAPTAATKHRRIEPSMDRCTACGTHPNSDSDLDLYDCVPGFSVCYRCVSWECIAQGS